MIRYERDLQRHLWAVADVRVGTQRIGFRVPLGIWDGAEPGAGGLLQLPVVVLPGEGGVELVEAAATRSGDASVRTVHPEGRELLAADDAGAEVLVVTSGNGRSLNVIRALGGRPLPALPSADPVAIRAFLDGGHVDLDVVLPVLDDPHRHAIRASLAPLRLEEIHHLLE